MVINWAAAPSSNAMVVLRIHAMEDMYAGDWTTTPPYETNDSVTSQHGTRSLTSPPQLLLSLLTRAQPPRARVLPSR